MNHSLLCALIVVVIMCSSLCLVSSKNAQILLYENENLGPTAYSFKFETSDGVRREEHGEISDPESDNAILRVQGSYSYITPDGKTFTVRYIADDQGYRPEISDSGAEKVPPAVGASTSLITTLQGGNAIG